jgi:tRNA nucleotidyltransferase (CCA-adding enzyme)
MVSVPALLSTVLDECKPGAAEADVLAEVKTFLNKLTERLKKQGTKATPVLGGSFAKDTWLRGDYDVDVFVAFDLKHRADDLSGLLEKALSPWKTDRVHGSRDYFQLKGHINYELIPVLAIKSPKDAQNVTDFSPKHVAWVNTHGKKLKDDIRLLKKFCKAQKVYGAESYIRGFSGHVVDILIIYYGGFLKLLRAARTWKRAPEKMILDYNNVYKGKAMLVLNESKTQGPLVLVDPVQPDRNAAAALTQENYDLFIAATKAFIARPASKFFVEQKPDLDALAKKGALLVDAVTIKEKEDVAGTKMVKAFEFLKTQLTRNDFTVADAGWTWDKRAKATFWFLTKEKTLPPTMTRDGPPIKITNNAAVFKKKYKNAKVVKGRLVASIPREFRTPQAVVHAALKSDYLKDKLVRIEAR